MTCALQHFGQMVFHVNQSITFQSINQSITFLLAYDLAFNSWFSLAAHIALIIILQTELITSFLFISAQILKIKERNPKKHQEVSP